MNRTDRIAELELILKSKHKTIFHLAEAVVILKTALHFYEHHCHDAVMLGDPGKLARDALSALDKIKWHNDVYSPEKK